MPNLERVVYIGDRAEDGREYQQRRYVFPHGKEVHVPDEFADILIDSGDFVLADSFGKPVTELYPDGGTLIFRRWGALGDLIMFRAAVSAFVRAHPSYRPILKCQQRFVEMFQHDPTWAYVACRGNPHDQTINGVITFDQVAEADHRGVEKHRVQLFLEAMTMEPIQLVDADWSLRDVIDEHQPQIRAWVERHLSNRGLLNRDHKLVAMGTRGSGQMKSLPRSITIRLIKELTAAGHGVILIEPDRAEAAPLLINDNVYEMTGRDALHCMLMLEYVDLAIVMDSGPLWMAHCANCPILAILGPTRAEQRITMHPRYADGGARSVALNEMMDCPACFESAKACNGRFDCMQRHPDWDAVVAAIIKTATSMLAETEIRLPVASNNA
jgi:ADP-heptose:LPS heptosyltransferase